MKHIYSFPVKLLAVVLTVLLLSTAVLSAGLTWYMFEQGYYEAENVDYYDTWAPLVITNNLTHTVYEHWDRAKEDHSYYPISESDGLGIEVVEEAGGKTERHSYLQENAAYHDMGEMVSENVTIHRYILEPIVSGSPYYASYQAYEKLYPHRFQVIILLAASAVMFLLALVYLLKAVGKRGNTEEYTLNIQDRVPLDIYLLVAGLGFFVLLQLAYELLFYNGPLKIWEVSVGGIFVICACLLGVALLLTLATRYKAGYWWRNTLLYRILHPLCRIALTLLRSLPLIWKAMLGYCLVTVADIFLLYQVFYYWEGFLLIFYVVLHLALLLVVGLFSLGLQKLKRAGQQLASGELDYQADTALRFPELCSHAANLNRISDGMAAAVAQRTRSERLKTELITNVSHDLKTPLTSIINYVDLLGQQPLEGEAKAYQEVLARQAARLKKLTEDLVEASKATTGNLEVCLERTDLCEFVSQSMGEYSERLESAGVTPVYTIPVDSVFVLADGKHLWRVMDNLLANVCKYALPGSRVYLDLTQQPGDAVVTLKNISSAQLNIEAQDLMERFVRGDEARSSEGSGLGLHIARSLMELQNGNLGLFIDGDLFKVELRMPLAPAFLPEATTETVLARIAAGDCEAEKNKTNEDVREKRRNIIYPLSILSAVAKRIWANIFKKPKQE